jgi:16S rRNA processing protein RimM
MALRPEATPDGMVCLCVIGPAHGVRGAVKVKSFTAAADDLAAYGPLQAADGTRYRVTSVKPDKLGARVTLDGVNERGAAEALRGTALYVAREKLPDLSDDDDFYHADLIGLAALDENGGRLGQVMAVHNFGAGDMLEIADATGKTGFYPFTKAVVPEIDLAAGHLTLLPPKEDEARPPEQVSAPTAPPGSKS